MIAPTDLEQLRTHADDQIQNYPFTMQVLRDVCSEVEQLQQHNADLRKVVQAFLEIDDWHDDTIAPTELIDSARKVLNGNEIKTTTPD